jgi:hypothetical protein
MVGWEHSLTMASVHIWLLVVMSPVALGFLYMSTNSAIYDIMFITEEIPSLVVEAARDLSTMGMNECCGQTGKSAHRLKSCQLSWEKLLDVDMRHGEHMY